MRVPTKTSRSLAAMPRTRDVAAGQSSSATSRIPGHPHRADESRTFGSDTSYTRASFHAATNTRPAE